MLKLKKVLRLVACVLSALLTFGLLGVLVGLAGSVEATLMILVSIAVAVVVFRSTASFVEAK